MSSQLRMALVSLLVITVLAVMAMRGGDPINPSTKKPAATTPAR